MMRMLTYLYTAVFSTTIVLNS